MLKLGVTAWVQNTKSQAATCSLALCAPRDLRFGGVAFAFLGY